MASRLFFLPSFISLKRGRIPKDPRLHAGRRSKSSISSLEDSSNSFQPSNSSSNTTLTAGGSDTESGDEPLSPPAGAPSNMRLELTPPVAVELRCEQYSIATQLSRSPLGRQCGYGKDLAAYV